jgi:hypothetical protein
MFDTTASIAGNGGRETALGRASRHLPDGSTALDRQRWHADCINRVPTTRPGAARKLCASVDVLRSVYLTAAPVLGMH